jgi:hypothetical protein
MDGKPAQYKLTEGRFLALVNELVWWCDEDEEEPVEEN